MTRLLAFAAALILATPAGAQTLTAVAPSSAAPALDARAERLVATWAVGDAAPVVAAFSADFQVAAAVAMPRVVRAFARSHGPLVSVAAEGTTRRPDGRIETVVAMTYARGTERLRLTWNANETLRTLARAPRMAPLVASR